MISHAPQESAPLSPSEPPSSATVPAPQPEPIFTPPTDLAQRPRLSEILAPLPPVRKRRGRFIVPILVGVVIIAAIGGLLTVLNGQENSLFTAAYNTTATASAPHTPVAVVAYQNSFATSAGGWPAGTYCSCDTGRLHVTGGGCFAPADSLDNLDVKVTIEQISGSTVETYGVIVRAVESDTRYDIVIDSESQWAASRCDAPKDQNTANCSSLVPFTSNSAIHGGLNTQNTIEVRANGSHFAVTINGANVGSFDDTTYAAGRVGLIANGSLTCVFTNLTITRYAWLRRAQSSTYGKAPAPR